LVNAVHIDDSDSCVMVTADIKKGETVEFRAGGELRSVTASSDIPIYHKAAVIPVKKGGFVYKYGEKIGVATCDIQPGDHVHLHNIEPVDHR